MTEEPQLLAMGGKVPVIISQTKRVSKILSVAKIHEQEQTQITENSVLLFGKEQFLPVFVFCLVSFPKFIKHTHGWDFQIIGFPAPRLIIPRVLKHLLSITFYQFTIYADIHDGTEGAKGNTNCRKT